MQHDVDGVADGDPAVASPCGTKPNAVAGAVDRLDYSADPHPVHGPRDVMIGLRSPCLVRVERHRDQDSLPAIRDDGRGKPLRC